MFDAQLPIQLFFLGISVLICSNLMKRQNNLPSTTYFSPPTPTITFNTAVMRSVQRESHPVEPSRPQQFQHRYSNNLQPTPPTNAFAHLRSQISNLRSEFTRLIQKDVNNERPKDDRPKFPPYPKEERLAAHSTIGFYNQPQGKSEQKGEYYFKSKLALNDQRGAVQNGETQKRPKLVENGANNNKYHKKYSFQTQDRRDQTSISQVIDPTKIQELQIEIRKLGEIKHKVEEQNLHLKREIVRIQKDLQSKAVTLETENHHLKNAFQQAQISISLKQSLVEKLEKDYTTIKNSLENYQAQTLKLKEQLSLAQKNQLSTKQSSKTIQELQEIQQLLSQRLKQKQQECLQLRQEKQTYEQKYRDQVSSIEGFQNIINDLQSQHEMISQQYKNIQLKYQNPDADKQSNQQGTKNLQEKLKIIEDQNIDLKKRVESYKKTVQQLNGANNSNRQKSVGLKEEVRKGKEEVKLLTDQLQMKEKLITSLYRDINILDADIRHSSHLKAVLGHHLKYIEELTQIIIELECNKLNQKYSHTDDESPQYS